MLEYFPTPYVDEILYSVFARYHLHSGNRSITTTIKNLFKAKKVTAMLDFPCYLSELSMNLRQTNIDSTCDYLIRNHTVVPFFRPFWSKEKYETIIELMKNNSRGDIHLKAGTRSNTIRPWQYLRYCPKCIHNDISEYGEAFWHRIHQLQGVLVCPKHNDLIYSSRFRTYEIDPQHYYVLSANSTEGVTINAPIYNDSIREKLFALAEDIMWVLNNGMEVQTTYNFKELYINKLKKEGLVSKNGRVAQDIFVNDFIKHYSEEFFQVLGLPVSIENKHNWISMMVREHKEEPHPLKHILLIRFLYGSVKEFFQNQVIDEPFLKGPYPCLNAAAEHYKSCIINNLDIEFSRNKKPYAKFTCHCGFSYVRNGPDKQESDLYRYDSILNYGSIWIDKFKELIEIQQLHLREVSRILKIDLKTVRKNIIRLGIKSKWMDPNIKTDNLVSESKQSNSLVSNQSLLNEYRETWITLRNSYRDLCKTQLRRIDMKTYNWLYYHDRIWLNENSPIGVIINKSHSKVNWKQRDEDLRTKVELIVLRLLNMEGKPIRISIERIGKELGHLYLLRNHLNKLPETQKFIEANCESKVDFIERKIRWAIKQLKSPRADIRIWEVKQKIGLAGSKLKEIDDIIMQELLKKV